MFIVVLGKQPVTTIDAYLYNHATRIATLDVGDQFVALIRTANDQYLTDYQAGRLGSGLYGVKVYTTFDEALAAFNDWATYFITRDLKPIDADL